MPGFIAWSCYRYWRMHSQGHAGITSMPRLSAPASKKRNSAEFFLRWIMDSSVYRSPRDDTDITLFLITPTNIDFFDNWKKIRKRKNNNHDEFPGWKRDYKFVNEGNCRERSGEALIIVWATLVNDFPRIPSARWNNRRGGKQLSVFPRQVYKTTLVSVRLWCD